MIKTTRKIFGFILVLLCSFFSAAPSSHAFPHMGGDGWLSLKTTHLNEEIQVRYRNPNGSYNRQAIQEIEQVLRCRITNKIHDVPVKLLELVDQIQDHFGSKEVMVLSGFRSPRFNQMLFHTGHKVARNSLHMAGFAMDISIPGVSTAELRDYAKGLKIGGVGYYPHNGFVHVDIGRVRYW